MIVRIPAIILRVMGIDLPTTKEVGKARQLTHSTRHAKGTVMKNSTSSIGTEPM
jgi:hypothetical protein